MSDEKVTAKLITVALWWKLRSASEVVIPRYTPAKWWECDVWRLTKSRFTEEYEIKLSVADFKADARKAKDLWNWNEVEKKYDRSASHKHQQLSNGEGPNRFWYVAPEGIGIDEVPEWAGLIHFTKGGHLMTEKDAPKMHTRKWEGNLESIFRTFYWRFWTHEVGKPSDAIEPFTNDQTVDLNLSPTLA